MKQNITIILLITIVILISIHIYNLFKTVQDIEPFKLNYEKLQHRMYMFIFEFLKMKEDYMPQKLIKREN